MPSRPRLLRAGDLVRFDGRLHTVAALEGTAVRLVDENQSPSVVLLAHLLSSAGFEVVTPSSVRAAVPAAGVLEGFPRKAVERAEWWQRHLVEMLTGRPMEDPHGRVRAAYDPAVRSLRQRELTKAAELEAGGHPASLKLIQRMRGRFEREGVLGLVDPRLRSVSDGTGRVDRRVVEALRKVVEDQTSRSTVSAQVLRRRMERALEAEHGPGVVALPSRTTFYRLLSALFSGRHTLGSARTRRSLAKQPDGIFGQLTVVRPGEVMEIDSTPLDVLVVHDDGTVDTVELTGIVDIATRTLAAAVLRPSTKAVDAALLLMRALLRYREIYGPHIPLGAAAQLDLILAESDLAARLAPNAACGEDDARNSVHSLHAHGMLLIDDDGSLWMTVPPGTPYSAPNGEWAFVEKKAEAPAELIDTTG
jgi:putative transposase